VLVDKSIFKEKNKMKKLLLILLCVPLMFSCGENEKDNYDKLIGYIYSVSELKEKLKL